jgi:predicted transcriptional regulator
MKLSDISGLLHCATLSGEESLNLEVETAVASDAMSEVLASPHPGALMITGLTNIQSMRTALVADIPAILYVRGKRPNDKTIELAREKNIILLATQEGMFDACGLLRERGLKGGM